jgi:hypothetical protein
VKRPVVTFLFGCAAGFCSFGIAAFGGTASGHGSEIPALATIAPLSSSITSLDGHELLPFVGFAMWGAVAVLVASSASRWSNACGLTILAIHSAFAAQLLSEAQFDKDLLVFLVPQATLVLALGALGIKRFARRD